LVEGREHMPLMHCNRERKKASTLGKEKEGDLAKGREHTPLRCLTIDRKERE